MLKVAALNSRLEEVNTLNRFDDEKIIISDFQMVEDGSVLFVDMSDEAEKVYSSIHLLELWDKWVDSSGKSDPPPDFYSDELRLMMDVMRIDDHAFADKKGKIQNPVNAKESKLYKELKDKGILEVFPNANVFINAKTHLPTEQDHCYDFYVKNFNRILSEHIKKIPLYNKNHPGYKSIFFVLEESSAYMECQNEKPDLETVKRDTMIKAEPHLFFWDSSFVEAFKGKGIDYLIWYAPFKLLRTDKEIIQLPKVAIFDCKFTSRVEVRRYKGDLMCSSEL